LSGYAAIGGRLYCHGSTVRGETVNNDLNQYELNWLNQIRVAADDRAALAGVPLNVKAKLTQHRLVDWVSPSAITISTKGREVLETA